MLERGREVRAEEPSKGEQGLGALKAQQGPFSPFPEAAGVGVIGVEGSSQHQAQGQKEGAQRWRHCRGLRRDVAGEGHCSHSLEAPVSAETWAGVAEGRGCCLWSSGPAPQVSFLTRWCAYSEPFCFLCSSP